jgi:GTPase
MLHIALLWPILYNAPMKFLDEAKIFIKSGNGGAGCVSFRREANVPFGGPDGGNGGRGGHIYVRAVGNLNTLIDYRYQQHFKAKVGMHGMGRQRDGSKADDIWLDVPVGTQVLNEDATEIIADLSVAGQEIMLLEGGNGGIGNMHFKTSVNQAPRKATPGTEGSEMWIWLKLKLFCDIGLVGLPNAGKSTLLSVVSRAKPKIADYPFTTLTPQLGVVYVDGKEFVMADIPGLIEGAHEGTGLGTKFLKHIERCGALLHMVDATNEDYIAHYHMIRNELESYSEILSGKHEVLALNKCDVLGEAELEEKRSALQKETGKQVFVISGVARTGITELTRELLKLARADKSDEASNFP